MKALFLLLFIPLVLKADDIQLRNGSVCKNVQIQEHSNGYFRVEIIPKWYIKIADSVVAKVENGKLTLNQESYVLTPKGIRDYRKISKDILTLEYNTDIVLPVLSSASSTHITQNNPSQNIPSLKYGPAIEKMSNAPLLVLSAAAFYAAYDYLQDASELSDAIDLSKGKGTDSLEKIRSRKTIGAIVFALAGLINTVYALTPVEVSAGNNQIGISYKYNF